MQTEDPTNRPEKRERRNSGGAGGGTGSENFSPHNRQKEYSTPETECQGVSEENLYSPPPDCSPLPITGATASPSQQAASDLYRRGFNIAPAKRASKEPFLWRRLVGSRIVSPDDDPDMFLQLFDNGANILVVCGRLSMNLAILDCDSPAAARWAACEFAKRGFEPWQVETARGGHFWFLSADGELDNVSGEGWELRGNLRYCIVPPSVHPSGVVYYWKKQAGELPPKIPLSELDWLNARLDVAPKAKSDNRSGGDDPLAALSSNNRAFIQHGASEGTRNNRLFSAACDLAANGFSQEQARELLLPRAARDFPEKEIRKAIRSAYGQTRQKAKPARNITIPKWKLATWWARAREWRSMSVVMRHGNGDSREGITAETARSAFLAFCERARRDCSEPFRASMREIAELANLSDKTAKKAISCLIQARLIDRRGRNTAGASLFAFGTQVVRKYPNTYVPPVGTGVSAHTGVWGDVFRTGALGRTAGTVWEVILVEALQPNEIASRVACHRTTVKRALDRLELANLAIRLDGVWIGQAGGENHLKYVAAEYGTLGLTARRKRQHAKERARYVSELILRAKRGWERKYLGLKETREQ